MTSFKLKIIAIITMVCDHLGDALFSVVSPLNFIGRMAFPIFAFQISEGYIHTKNIKRYLLRIFVFAIISQIPFYLFIHKFFGGSGLNIFFTLFLGLTSILLYDKIKKKVKSKNKIINVLAILPAIILSIIGQLLDVDYGWWGVILIFVFFIFKDNKIKTVIAFLILCIIKYSIEIILNGFSYLYIQLMLWTMLPIALIVLYNGEQGRKIKYLSYAFYPIHLLLLYFLF